MKRAKRKLAAVLSADVAGYSRLMAADELQTVKTLKQCRRLMTDCVQAFNGRVVDAPGDNLLAEFASTVDAVECAVDIQKRLQQMNAGLPMDQRMQLRIGINLGDVIYENGNIYGDGINIAARIESLAEPGEIYLARSVYDQVQNKLPFGFVYLGEHEVKNIAEPVRVYRIEMNIAVEARKDKRVVNPPERFSIAVLPFVNMSGDQEQEYFSDGLTEDLITDLSKLSNLFVIARNSVFTYKGRAVKVQDVGRDMGVRYVLEGSVRKAGQRVRITAQLVDAVNGGHIWADRYDRHLEDIFSVQDEVTREIVSVLAVKMGKEDQKRLYERDTENIAAYDLFLRGLEYFHRYSSDTNQKARELFAKAIELDTTYTAAYVKYGWTYLSEWMLGWTNDKSALDRAYELAIKAFSTGKAEATSYCLLGNAYLWKKQHEKALALHKEYEKLDFDTAEVLSDFANILNWSGKPEEAIKLAQKALRLDPLFPAYNLFNLGHAYYLTRRYENALPTLREALVHNPDFFPPRIYLAASYLEMGQTEEARQEIADVIKKSPQFHMDDWHARLPYKNPRTTERIMQTLNGLQLR